MFLFIQSLDLNILSHNHSIYPFELTVSNLCE